MQIFSIMKITDLDFGSIPDWLGAIGTIGAVWVALWQTTGGFKKQQNRRDIQGTDILDSKYQYFP